MLFARDVRRQRDCNRALIVRCDGNRETDDFAFANFDGLHFSFSWNRQVDYYCISQMRWVAVNRCDRRSRLNQTAQKGVNGIIGFKTNIKCSTVGDHVSDEQQKKEDDKGGDTSTLVVNCTPGEKAAWVKAAKPGKLADWVRSVLNKAAILSRKD